MCTFLRTACRFSVTTFHSTIVIRAASSSRNVNARLNSLLVDMPKLKNVQGASEVRAAVLKNKAKRTGYEPSEVTLNVLGPGSAGTCRALMLSSDSVA
jgi:malic enzyme